MQNGATISADGSRVAFTSFAGNLFFGDANQRLDAFVAERQPEQGTGLPPTGLGSDGPDARLEFSSGGPQIGVRAKSASGGRVLLTVSVPAAGGVSAVARARAGVPRKSRTLGVAKGRAKGLSRSSLRLELRPVERYRGEMRERGRIRGRVVVTYVASRGGRRATASLGVLFRQGVGPGKQSERGVAK